MAEYSKIFSLIVCSCATLHNSCLRQIHGFVLTRSITRSSHQRDEIFNCNLESSGSVQFVGKTIESFKLGEIDDRSFAWCDVC
jgi:hypothetical protein